MYKQNPGPLRYFLHSPHGLVIMISIASVKDSQWMACERNAHPFTVQEIRGNTGALLQRNN